MQKPIPKLTKDLGLDFWWDTQKLWEVDLPIEEMKLQEFEWMLELPFWDYDGVMFALTPKQVILNKDKYHTQYERTMSSDLNFPVNAIFTNNRWVIMDGIHRLLKAYTLENKTIKVKKALRKHIPLIEAK